VSEVARVKRDIQDGLERRDYLDQREILVNRVWQDLRDPLALMELRATQGKEVLQDPVERMDLLGNLVKWVRKDHLGQVAVQVRPDHLAHPDLPVARPMPLPTELTGPTRVPKDLILCWVMQQTIQLLHIRIWFLVKF
jgi:hypothetical protein